MAAPLRDIITMMDMGANTEPDVEIVSENTNQFVNDMMQTLLNEPTATEAHGKPNARNQALNTTSLTLVTRVKQVGA